MAANKKHTLLRYLAYAKPHRATIALLVMCGIAAFLSTALGAYIVRQIIDQVIVNRPNHSADQRLEVLWWLGGAAAAVITAATILGYIRGVSVVKVASSIVFDIRQSLWRHLQRLSLGFHQTRPTGSILSRLMGDIEVSQQMVTGGLVGILIDMVSGVAAIAILLWISWQLTIVALVVLPIYCVMYRRLNPRIRQASRDLREQTAVMSGEAVERLSGIVVVQSFAQEPAEQEYFEAQSEELRGLSIRRGRLHRGLRATSSWMMEIARVAAWIIGGYLAIREKLTVGQIQQFTATAVLLYRPIRRFSEINILYQTSMAAIERVFAIFDIVPEVQNRPNAIRRMPAEGGIEFDDVSFRYGDGPVVLEDISFRIAPGERVAVVGESGAGKSTLATLVPRLYDVTSGAIRIDEVDVRDYRVRRLRRTIGIVLQDTILFSGRVRENLRYGRRDATDAEITEAAIAANAQEFIVRFPDGYDTVIGERGLTLSGGQRQRISLARTILQNPRILILDEATSSLDSESENLITEALERAQTGRTCLIIAHRLSTVLGADRILVLKQGRLVEEGTHAELLAKDSHYSFLFEQQFRPLQELMNRGGQDGA